MWFFDGRRTAPDPPQTESTGGSPAYREWLKSNPEPGEAFVDTGLSSAADCQKLRWRQSEAQQELMGKLMAEAVARDELLFREGNPEAEAKRINDLVAPLLKGAGLDPERFGVSMPAPGAQQVPE